MRNFCWSNQQKVSLVQLRCVLSCLPISNVFTDAVKWVKLGTWQQQATRQTVRSGRSSFARSGESSSVSPWTNSTKLACLYMLVCVWRRACVCVTPSPSNPLYLDGRGSFGQRWGRPSDPGIIQTRCMNHWCCEARSLTNSYLRSGRSNTLRRNEKPTPGWRCAFLTIEQWVVQFSSMYLFSYFIFSSAIDISTEHDHFWRICHRFKTGSLSAG